MRQFHLDLLLVPWLARVLALRGSCHLLAGWPRNHAQSMNAFGFALRAFRRIFSAHHTAGPVDAAEAHEGAARAMATTMDLSQLVIDIDERRGSTRCAGTVASPTNHRFDSPVAPRSV